MQIFRLTQKPSHIFLLSHCHVFIIRANYRAYLSICKETMKKFQAHWCCHNPKLSGGFCMQNNFSTKDFEKCEGITLALYTETNIVTFDGEPGHRINRIHFEKSMSIEVCFSRDRHWNKIRCWCWGCQYWFEDLRPFMNLQTSFIWAIMWDRSIIPYWRFSSLRWRRSLRNDTTKICKFSIK